MTSPFLSPTKITSPSNLPPSVQFPAKHVPITGLFGPTLAEFNQTTSTTIALKD
jgi:hypothetical protein